MRRRKTDASEQGTSSSIDLYSEVVTTSVTVRDLDARREEANAHSINVQEVLELRPRTDAAKTNSIRYTL